MIYSGALCGCYWHIAHYCRAVKHVFVYISCWRWSSLCLSCSPTIFFDGDKGPGQRNKDRLGIPRHVYCEAARWYRWDWAPLAYYYDVQLAYRGAAGMFCGRILLRLAAFAAGAGS